MITSRCRYNWRVSILTTFKRYRELIIQRAYNLVKFARNLKELYIRRTGVVTRS